MSGGSPRGRGRFGFTGAITAAFTCVIACGDLDASTFERAFPTRNDHLRERLADDPLRILPRNEYVYWALDAEFFSTGGGVESSDSYVSRKSNPYHGNGFWIENRVELIPIETVRLDLKFVPWVGTSSYGYAAASHFFVLGGLTFEDEIGDSGWTFRTRASDLGLQTYGLGTLVEDRPMSGTFVEFERGDWRFRETIDGTGTLHLQGETLDTHASFRDELVSVGVLHYHNQAGRFGKSFTTGYVGSRVSFGPSNRAIGGMNDGGSGDGDGRSARDFVGIELSANRVSYAALAKARLSGGGGEGAGGVSAVDWMFEPSIRHYGDGFGGSFVGSVQQQYTGYDSQGASYTNAINIFRTDDHVTAPAARLWAAYRVAAPIDFFVDSEVGKFFFHRSGVRPEFYHFWSVGTRLYPMRTRNDYLSVSLTDKYLTAYSPLSGPTDPTTADDDYNKPRFLRELTGVVTLHGAF